MTEPQHPATPQQEAPEELENASQDSGCQESGYQESGGFDDRSDFLATREHTQNHSQTQKLQRCWFVTLGLVGSFSFVASQMSLAVAQTNVLITDYATDSAAEDYAAAPVVTDGYVAGHNIVADPSYVSEQPSFQAAAPAAYSAPVPEAFIEAPASSSEAVAAFSPVVPAAPVLQPTPVQPTTAQPTPVQPTTAQVEGIQAEDVQIEDIQVEATHQTAAALATPESPISVGNAIVEFEITPAAVINEPTVSEVHPPTFTNEPKPQDTKVARRGHPLLGFLEASAVAAPISTYAVNNAGTTPSVILASNDASNDIDADFTPAAVPDSLPASLAAPVEAAPPVVEAAPPIVEAAPEPVAPIFAEEPVPVQPTEIVPAALPENTAIPDEYIFVDPTEYSIGATDAPEVVISEQSTGCEFTVGQNQGVPNGACGTGVPNAPAPVATGNASGAQPASAAVPSYQQAPAPVASAPAVNVGPVSFSASGIQLSTSAAGREYLNRTVRPLVNLQASERFIFPLSVPSPITSLFGFRIHPITGDQRFHAGTDIGAAQGTPVLAAQDGFVTAASSAGGYGLMVVLQHELEETQLESRYAHLAEMFVSAGDEVKKGDIIGLVGSTGNSTGPHLHFEMRQMTADGWVLVNADGLVQASLANLVAALNSPMQSLSFNLSDFNLSNLRAGSTKGNSPSGVTLPQISDKDGLPFRPAQPNAS